MANDQKNGASLPIENIVLVGHTGNGKSATGNSIVGKPVFESKFKASGVTRECKSAVVDIPEGPKLRVIDTPGLLDPKELPDYISEEVVKCLHLAEGGLHAVLLVLSVRNRFTDEQAFVLRSLQAIFGSQIVDNVIVVFTCGDDLKNNNETIEEYLDDCPKILKNVIASCENRIAVFENSTKDEGQKKKQVEELLNLIDRLRKRTGYKPYTEGMCNKIKEEADRHKKEQEELHNEKHMHSDEDFEKMNNKLMEINAQNLKAMADMMKDNMKLVMDAQTKLIEHIENVDEKRQLEVEKRHREEEEAHQKEMQQMIDQMERNHRQEMEALKERQLAEDTRHHEDEEAHQKQMQQMLDHMECTHRQEMDALKEAQRMRAIDENKRREEEMKEIRDMKGSSNQGLGIVGEIGQTIEQGFEEVMHFGEGIVKECCIQ